MLEEPGASRSYSRVEEEAASDRAANALRKEDLVVFVGDRGHHEPKDMQEWSKQDW